MIEMFKLTHDLYDSHVVEGFLEFKDTPTRGHHFTLFKQRFNYDIRKYAFRNRVVEPWDGLPKELVEAQTIACFERRFDKLWKGTSVMFDPDINFMEDTNKLKSLRSAHQLTDRDIVDLSTEAM